MKKVTAFVLGLLTVLPCTASASSLLVSPLPTGDAAAIFTVSGSRVRYELPSDDFTIERVTESVVWGYESFFAGLGYVSTTDFDDVGVGGAQPGSDPGYLLAFGARGAAWRAGDFSIDVDAQFQLMNEKMISGGERYQLQSLELFAGVVAAWEQPNWRVYTGIQTVPYSMVSVNAPGFEAMERADFIIAHAGGGLNVGPCFLDVDVQFLGDEGLRVSLGYPF